MQTKFEHFAATSLMGGSEHPPRQNGELMFDREWEERAFSIAISLSKKGYYEWESFRQQLIYSIAEWESAHCKDDSSYDSSWDYYQRWLLALERIVLGSSIISSEELEAKTNEFISREQQATSNS